MSFGIEEVVKSIDELVAATIAGGGGGEVWQNWAPTIQFGTTSQAIIVDYAVYKLDINGQVRIKGLVTNDEPAPGANEVLRLGNLPVVKAGSPFNKVSGHGIFNYFYNAQNWMARGNAFGYDANTFAFVQNGIALTLPIGVNLGATAWEETCTFSFDIIYPSAT